METSTPELSYLTSRYSECETEEPASFDATGQAMLPPRENHSFDHGNSVDFSGINVQEKCERITSNLLDTYRNFSLLKAKFANFQGLITPWKHGKRAGLFPSSKRVHSKRVPSKKNARKQTTVADIQCNDQSVQTTAPVEQQIDATLATATPVMASQSVENFITHIVAMRLSLERVVRQLQQLNADSHDTKQIGYGRHMKQVECFSSLAIGMNRVQKSVQTIESHLEELFIYLAEAQDAHTSKVESNFANMSSLIQNLRTTASSPSKRDSTEILVRFDRNAAVIGDTFSLISPFRNEERQAMLHNNPKRLSWAVPRRRLSKKQEIRRKAQLITRLRAKCQMLENIVAERSNRIRTLEEEREGRNAFFDRVQGFVESLLTHTSFTNGTQSCQCHVCPERKSTGNEMVKVNATRSHLVATQGDLVDHQSDFSPLQKTGVVRNSRTANDVKVLLSRQRLLRRTWEFSCLKSGERLAALNDCYKQLFDHHLLLRKRFLQMTCFSSRKLRTWRKQSKRLSRLRALTRKKLHHKVRRLETHYMVLLANLEAKVMHLVDLLDGNSSGSMLSQTREKKSTSQHREQGLETSYNRIVFHLDWLRDCVRILLVVLLKCDAGQTHDASVLL